MDVPNKQGWDLIQTRLHVGLIIVILLEFECSYCFKTDVLDIPPLSSYVVHSCWSASRGHGCTRHAGVFLQFAGSREGRPAWATYLLTLLLSSSLGLLAAVIRLKIGLVNSSESTSPNHQKRHLVNLHLHRSRSCFRLWPLHLDVCTVQYSTITAKQTQSRNTYPLIWRRTFTEEL